MNIAIIGYGRMGKEIEAIALERGHQIVAKIDQDNASAFEQMASAKIDVAIEFSQPSVARDNILKCFAANVPVVSGTTGWAGQLEEVQQFCRENGKAFLYASNFSLGMNVFFAVNNYLSGIMDSLPGYQIGIEETHHLQKLDSPSGTAISIANDCIQKIERLQKWEESTVQKPGVLNIKAYREGNVFGDHSVVFESEFDKITISHSAKSRKGFAMGAVLAAEFLKGKKGVFSMNDVLNI
jgi:4-hydroxy-tetrahydrodipicolinate reductase